MQTSADRHDRKGVRGTRRHSRDRCGWFRPQWVAETGLAVMACGNVVRARGGCRLPVGPLLRNCFEAVVAMNHHRAPGASRDGRAITITHHTESRLDKETVKRSPGPVSIEALQSLGTPTGFRPRVAQMRPDISSVTVRNGRASGRSCPCADRAMRSLLRVTRQRRDPAAQDQQGTRLRSTSWIASASKALPPSACFSSEEPERGPGAINPVRR